MQKVINSVELDPANPEFFKIHELDRQYGILGKFFGDTKSAPVYIAGVVVIAAVLVGVYATIWPGQSQPTDTWKVISPIITMILGFLFGKNT